MKDFFDNSGFILSRYLSDRLVYAPRTKTETCAHSLNNTDMEKSTLKSYLITKSGYVPYHKMTQTRRKLGANRRLNGQTNSFITNWMG